MRISTSQIFDTGSLSIQQSQSALYKLQNQISSGRRVLTPQDDPVAASQALVVTQSMEVNAQYMNNQGQAKNQLGLIDSQLSSLVNALQNVRDRVIQAGNTTTLSQSDRASIATEIEARLGEILGIANSDNGVGEYLFSGYSGNIRPFAVDGSLSPRAPASSSPVGYYGDTGERLLQVSSSRQMAVSVSGSEVFMTSREGNGTFLTGTGGNPGVRVGSANTGTATADPGSVIDRTRWDAAMANAGAGLPLEIRIVDNGGVLSYEIHDPVGGTTAMQPFTSGAAIPLLTNAAVDFGAQVTISGVPDVGDTFVIAPGINKGSGQIDAGSVIDPQKWAAGINNPAVGTPVEIRFFDVAGVLNYGLYDPVGGLTALRPFAKGQAISMVTAGGVDMGSQVTINEMPAAGDTFIIQPSASQSVFQTLQNILGILASPIGTGSYTTTQYTNELGAELTNIDRALENISRVQATVGTRMREIESLASTLSDMEIQYKSALSDLQDIDYAKSISDFIKQQMNLEAAQKSFAQVSGLSLFNYL